MNFTRTQGDISSRGSVLHIFIYLLCAIAFLSPCQSTPGWPCPDHNVKREFKLRLPQWNDYISVSGEHPRKVYPKMALEVLHTALKSNGVHMNGIMIGACDGTRDEYIDFVRSHEDTSALLVEPVTHNFADLKESFPNMTVPRVDFLQAAVDASCTASNATRSFGYINQSLEVDRPTAKHWARRQLGSMEAGTLNFLKTNFGPGGYFAESTVECFSPGRLASKFLELQAGLNAEKRRCQRRGSRLRTLSTRLQNHLSDLHILKMDTEGLDYNVMTGFLDQVMCGTSCRAQIAKHAPHGQQSTNMVFKYSDLRPLMIMYETKIFVEREGGEEKREKLEARLKHAGYHIFGIAGDTVALRKVLDV